MKQFDKSKLFEDIKKDEKPVAPAYQKKDFFDTISCDSLEGRERPRESHRRNLETFGRDVHPEGGRPRYAGPGGQSYGGRGGYGYPRRGGYRGAPRQLGSFQAGPFPPVGSAASSTTPTPQ